jgi:hypothetical protein
MGGNGKSVLAIDLRVRGGHFTDKRSQWKE